MLEALRTLPERLGLGLELSLVVLALALGWWLGGFWFFAAILASMAILSRGLR